MSCQHVMTLISSRHMYACKKKKSFTASRQSLGNKSFLSVLNIAFTFQAYLEILPDNVDSSPDIPDIISTHGYDNVNCPSPDNHGDLDGSTAHSLPRVTSSHSLDFLEPSMTSTLKATKPSTIIKSVECLTGYMPMSGGSSHVSGYLAMSPYTLKEATCTERHEVQVEPGDDHESSVMLNEEIQEHQRASVLTHDTENDSCAHSEPEEAVHNQEYDDDVIELHISEEEDEEDKLLQHVDMKTDDSVSHGHHEDEHKGNADDSDVFMDYEFVVFDRNRNQNRKRTCSHDSQYVSMSSYGSSQETETFL